MPQTINVTTPEALGPISAPATGDPRNSLDIRVIVQKMLNMLAGALQVASPSGLIAWTAGAAAPTGWLVCDGRTVNRADYPSLFTAIGTLYGGGNGSTTFNLPDLRGRSAIGVGQGTNLTLRTLGSQGGEQSHALTIQEMPSHVHNAPTASSTSAGVYEIPPFRDVNTGANGYATYDYAGAAPTDGTGGNAAHNNMPPYLVLTPIIRT